MTYKELKNRLNKCEYALKAIKDGTHKDISTIDVQKTTTQLNMIKESLQNQIKQLKEGNSKTYLVTPKKGQTTAVSLGDDEKDALKDADDVKAIKGIDGEEIKEGIEFTSDETKAIAKKVGQAVAKALKDSGDDVAHMKATHIEPNSFEIYVEYKNNSDDSFAFHLSKNKLHLADFSFNKALVDVSVKPSGEPILHVDVLANELVKHFKSLRENKDLKEDPYQTTYIKVGRRDYKKAMSILDGNLDPTYVKMDIVDDDGDGNVIIYFNFRASDDGEPGENVEAFIYDAASDLQAQGIHVTGSSHDIDEGMDINDPVLMKMRASKTKVARKKAIVKGGERHVGKKRELLAKLKAKRAQVMKDMENDPSIEPEGGPVADMYGDQLNKIDKDIARASGRKQMDYDTAVGKVDEYAIDPAEYGDIGAAYLKGFNKPHSLNLDQLEMLGRKIVKQLYKGDFEAAKAKHLKEGSDDDLFTFGFDLDKIQHVIDHLKNNYSDQDYELHVGRGDTHPNAVTLNNPDMENDKELGNLLIAAEDQEETDYQVNRQMQEDEEEDAKNDADYEAGWHDDPRKDEGDETDDYGRPHVDPKGSRTFLEPDEMLPHNRFKKMTQKEDTDIGHQDDEPSMLSATARETAEYSAKLLKKLQAYDQHDGEVDFPNWWQSKLILAREYMSAAFHYLDSEEKQPALDQLALESVVKEGRGVMDSIKDAVEELMFDGDISEKEAAMELVIAISDQYGFDLAGHEFDIFHKGMSENIDKVAGGIPYKVEGNKAIINEPLDDATKERLMGKAKEHGYHAAPNQAGGITITLKKGMHNESDNLGEERYRKVTDDDKGLDGVFYVEDDAFVDLDYGKYKSATKDLLDLAMEQGHEYESVENYYEYADHFENELKDYAEGEVPDWQMNDLAVKYGTDYSQFYGEEDDDDDDMDENKKTLKEYASRDFDEIFGALGYRQGFDEFIEDNPGAVEALMNWIGSISEFRKRIGDEYSKEEQENLGFYYGDDDEDVYENAELDKVTKAKRLIKQQAPAMNKLSQDDPKRKAFIDKVKQINKKYKQLLAKQDDKVSGTGKDQELDEAGPGFKHDCAAKVVHEKYGKGNTIPEKHTLVKEGNKYVVTHYDVLFENGNTVLDIPVNELKIETTNEHWHKGYKKKKK